MKVLTHESPVGPLTLVVDEGLLLGCHFANADALPEPTPRAKDALLDETRRQLDAWFAKKRTTFALPLAPRGTDFQRAVWNALRTIPFGETASYLELAKKVGNAKAVRAVGGANGANPIPIIIPCHRVIGANGSLTGFGGGLERKRFLLEHESPQRSLPGT